MSAKKSWLNGYPLFSANNMSSNVTTSETDVTNYDSLEIWVDWTATAVVGILAVEVMYNQSGLWTALSGLDAIPITGTSGNHQIMLKWVPFGKIRLTYTKTSGSGVLNATITAKGT